MNRLLHKVFVTTLLLCCLLLLSSCFGKKKQSLQAQAKLYGIYIKQVSDLGYIVPQEDIDLSAQFDDAVSYKNYAFTNSYEDQVNERQAILNDLITFKDTYIKSEKIFNGLIEKGYDHYNFNNKTAYFIYPLKMSLLTAPLLKEIEQTLLSALEKFDSKRVENIFYLDKSAPYYLNVVVNYEKYNYADLTKKFFKSCKYMPYSFNFRPYLEEVYTLEGLFDVKLSNFDSFHGYCSFDHLYYEIKTAQRLYTVIDTIENDLLYRVNDTINYASNLLNALGPMTSPINGVYISIENKLSNVYHDNFENKAMATAKMISKTFSTKDIEHIKLYFIKDKNNVFSFPKQVFVDNKKIPIAELTTLDSDARYDVEWGQTLKKK